MISYKWYFFFIINLAMNVLFYAIKKRQMVFIVFYVIGYGRTEKEAISNCIRNFLEFLLEEEKMVSIIKESIKLCKVIFKYFFRLK